MGAAMLMKNHPPAGTDVPEGIGLFDLDGTLLAWDCQLLFRHHVLREEPWRLVFLPIFLAFTPLVGLLGAAGLKRVFLGFLCGMERERLEKYARSFAEEVLPTVYPEMRERIERHRRNGHVLILASASPDWYVLEIGRALGFDVSLGTVVETGERMPLFPDLENHKGEAKVERLRRELPAGWMDGEKLRHIHGYTDSCADLPMLRLCGQATVVNPGKALAERAREEGWEIIRPRRPWRGRIDHTLRVAALMLGLGGDPAGLRQG
jgi:HAD superfamily hydrolase (TIGR01490 family)